MSWSVKNGTLREGHLSNARPTSISTSNISQLIQARSWLELDTDQWSVPGCDQADHSPVSGAEGAAPSSWICSTGALTSVSSTVTTSHLILSLGNIVINVENRKEGYQEAALSQKKFDLSHKKLFRVPLIYSLCNGSSEQSEASFHWFDNWVKICKDYGFSVGGFNQELYWGWFINCKRSDAILAATSTKPITIQLQPWVE